MFKEKSEQILGMLPATQVLEYWNGCGHSNVYSFWLFLIGYSTSYLTNLQIEARTKKKRQCGELDTCSSQLCTDKETDPRKLEVSNTEMPAEHKWASYSFR